MYVFSFSDASDVFSQTSSVIIPKGNKTRGLYYIPSHYKKGNPANKKSLELSIMCIRFLRSPISHLFTVYEGLATS